MFSSVFCFSFKKAEIEEKETQKADKRDTTNWKKKELYFSSSFRNEHENYRIKRVVNDSGAKIQTKTHIVYILYINTVCATYINILNGIIIGWQFLHFFLLLISLLLFSYFVWAMRISQNQIYSCEFYLVFVRNLSGTKWYRKVVIIKMNVKLSRECVTCLLSRRKFKFVCKQKIHVFFYISCTNEINWI